jgi:hypothetical protein
MPAGHNCPPHPFFRSSCSFSGGESRPSKSISEAPAVLMVASGTRSWLTLNTSGVELVSDMLGVGNGMGGKGMAWRGGEVGGYTSGGKNSRMREADMGRKRGVSFHTHTSYE